MNVDYGTGKTQYGPGVDIYLSGDEIATAIDSYLVAHGIHISGARTTTINGELIKNGKVYVDPSGFVIHDGDKYSGKGAFEDESEDESNDPFYDEGEEAKWEDRDITF